MRMQQTVIFICHTYDFLLQSSTAASKAISNYSQKSIVQTSIEREI